MSYTRRMGNFPKQGNAPLSSVGQRRPQGNNFSGAGGQNQNKQQPQQQNQQQHQQQNQHQNVQQYPVQQEKPKPVQQQAVQNQPKPPQTAQTPRPQAHPAQPPLPPMQQQPPPLPTNMQQAAEKLISEHDLPDKPVISTSAVEGISGIGNGSETESVTTQKTRPFWMKRNGRINKAERAKRRNVRLRKLLQPKNALMIINELVGHVTFEMAEAKNNFEDVYKAIVLVEGTEFTGLGKSKALAKSAAAESAVRTMILKKLKITATASPPEEEDEENKNIKMEVNEEGNQVININEENQEDVSWTHIASFAIHKLFSSWGEDGNVADMMSRTTSMASLHETASIKDTSGLQTQPEQKPAKKLPDNAALMNPIMLLNQMHPSAKYEEVGKTGNPPNIQFTIKCIVGEQSFVGIGQNKKAARKQAAFEACKTLLGIQYPPDILEGTAAKATPMETA